MLFAFIGFVSIFSSDPPTENEAPDTKVAQPIVQPQAEPVPVAATPPVKEQAPQADMETETETSDIIIAPAVNVEELSCPEPVSVKLEYNKACLSGLHPHPLGQNGRKPDTGERAMDVLDRADLPFPHSLPEFQRLFPDDAACAAYLEKARWGDGFACPHCGTAGEPFHFENRPGVLRCRKCRQNTGLTVGTVME